MEPANVITQKQIGENNPLIASDDRTRAIHFAYDAMLNMISDLKIDSDTKENFIILVKEIYVERKASLFLDVRMQSINRSIQHLFQTATSHSSDGFKKVKYAKFPSTP